MSGWPETTTRKKADNRNADDDAPSKKDEEERAHSGPTNTGRRFVRPILFHEPILFPAPKPVQPGFAVRRNVQRLRGKAEGDCEDSH